MKSTDATKLPYQLTNDYLFRAVFQERPKALEGLCRVVLGLKETDIVSVTLQNPIELGKNIDSKDLILDLAVLVNNSVFLNLEMQMYYDRFWTDRSLYYACRSFTNLNKGETYDKILPMVQVGFLNDTLFPEHPEFFASYKLTNVSQKENPYIYNDKLRISVVNLSRIDLATEQDKASGIELWARVFTATTWEEINMLAENNIYLQEVVSGVRQLTEEEKIRQQCEAREINAYWERIREADRQREKQELQQAKQEAQQAKQELQEIQAKLKDKIRHKISKGKSLEQIADELEEDVEVLRPIFEELIVKQ